MNTRELDKTLALAGVVQAVSLVNEVANTGTLPDTFYQASLASLFKFDADSTSDVYGGKSNIELGLNTLAQLLAFEQNNDLMQIARYGLNVLHLERKLARNPKMLEHIHNKLLQIKSQIDYFSLTDERVIESIATLYQETISTFDLRIQVKGNPLHLKEPIIANQIRALLFCSIRSAFLWHQLGGSRINLFLSLSKIRDSVEYWLSH